MRIGSLVITEHNFAQYHGQRHKMGGIITVDNPAVSGPIYTVSEVHDAQHIQLEESIIYLDGKLGILYYDGEYFKEIQPPMEVSIEALLQIEELV